MLPARESLDIHDSCEFTIHTDGSLEKRCKNKKHFFKLVVIDHHGMDNEEQQEAYYSTI